MYAPNVERLLELIQPDDVVLDIGGWACPFNRANFVLDAQPYDTRGAYALFGGPRSQGGDAEFFRADTWIVRDICEKTPYPFADKSIDWVICSHTLEDVRDPLWVCQEMTRIAKRGYIEVPSREAESSRGWELPNLAGLSHHRWLIDIDPGRSHIDFLMKFHRIHTWRLSLPAAYLRDLPPEAHVQWLFWTDGFTYAERTIHGVDKVDQELARFVAAKRPYPPMRRAVGRLADLVRTSVVRLARMRGNPRA